MGKRILYIEDEEEMVSMMRLRLEAAGYEYSSAADGEEGLKKIYSEKPGMVLLDILLPKIDGLALCRKIKDDPAVKNIPVLIVSASSGKDMEAKCFAAGADDIIVKPFDSRELLEKINKLVQKKQV